MQKQLLCFLLLLTFVLFSSHATKTFAQETAVSCWKLDVGVSQTKVVPPECGSATSDGELEFPANMDCFKAPAENSGGLAGEYCKMPPAKDGSYAINGNPWGSKEMIGVLYTVAKQWKAKYPKGKLYLGDISSAGHKTHFWGIAADLTGTTNGNDMVANMNDNNYNRTATIDYANFLVDTGYMDTIWYNDTAVQKAMCTHAHEKFPKRFPSINDCYNKSNVPGMRWLEAHANHFHLNIDRAKLYSLSSTKNLGKSKLKSCNSVSKNIC